jgi:hypothetical protein
MEKIHQDESWQVTSDFIEENRNWNVASQSYKVDENELDNVKLADCKIYQRGQYIILECNGIVHYWEKADTHYPFFQMAIEFMDLDNLEDWKTAGKLVALRMGIRQTEVNGCGYVDEYLTGKKMTHNRYNTFMRTARKQDLEHHGSHTF